MILEFEQEIWEGMSCGHHRASPGRGMASCRGDRVNLASQSSPTALDLGSVFEEELQQEILNSSCALGAVLGAPTM